MMALRPCTAADLSATFSRHGQVLQRRAQEYMPVETALNETILIRSLSATRPVIFIALLWSYSQQESNCARSWQCQAHVFAVYVLTYVSPLFGTVSVPS